MQVPCRTLILTVMISFTADALPQRLALHPQTYIKLSPLLFHSSLSNPLTTPSSTRAADHSSSLVQSASEVLSSAAASAQGDLLLPPREKSEETRSRVRVFLEVLVEAFGTERIFWGCHLNAAGPSLPTTDAQGEAGEAIKEWYETVRAGLVGMGLGRQGELDAIFAECVQNPGRDIGCIEADDHDSPHFFSPRRTAMLPRYIAFRTSDLH